VTATQTVVLEFDSVDAARAWYTSDAYPAAAKPRHAAAESFAVILWAVTQRSLG